MLWTCLSTIFACSWTILHLNVPPEEKVLQSFWRKTKWMFATILFPEFIFSKAVAELQMAVDDLNAMEKKSRELQFRVAYGWWPSRLYRFFHCFDRMNCQPLKNAQCDICETSSEEPQGSCNSQALTEKDADSGLSSSPKNFDEYLHGKRIWTLTHSYFANMDGLVRLQRGDAATPITATSITAHALVNCCIGGNHDPLPYLYASKAEIEDKSKADLLVKILAVWQVLWLIITIITRGARGLRKRLASQKAVGLPKYG